MPDLTEEAGPSEARTQNAQPTQVKKPRGARPRPPAHKAGLKKKRRPSLAPVSPVTPESATVDVECAKAEELGPEDGAEPGRTSKLPDAPDGSQPAKERVKKAQELLDRVFHKTNTIAAPLADIGSSWMRVAWLGLVAMSCIVPGASIFVIPFMFVYCCLWKRHLLGVGPRSLKFLPMFQEFGMWTILFLNVYGDILFVFRSWEVFKEGTSLRSIVAQMQINQISDILSLGSILLWRVLSIHIIEVSAQVHWHKCEALRKCSRNGVDKIVDDFSKTFGDSWHLDDEHVPDCFSKVSRARWSVPCGFDKVLIRASTFVMFGGMLLLQVRLLRSLKSLESLETRVFLSGGVSWTDLWAFEEARESFSGPIDGVSWPDLVVVVAAAIPASMSWNNAISGIFSSTLGMKRNRVQLLLFSCISSGSVEYLNASERETLDSSELKADSDLKLKYLHIRGSLKEAERVSGRNGSQEVPETNLFDALVLEKVKSVEDVEAWWAVRRYIQIDFKDESAIMDACGAIVFLLLLGLLFTGIVEWSLHSDPFSPGFLLILMLSSVLTFAMFRVFEVCIGINNVLDRDTLFLTEAMLKAVHLRKHWDRTKVIAALQAIERRLSVYDDKQKLLGITVSANLRNGWIASLVVTFFSWGSRFMTPVLSHIDVDNLQHLILNKTNLVRRAKMA